MVLLSPVLAILVLFLGLLSPPYCFSSDLSYHLTIFLDLDDLS